MRPRGEFDGDEIQNLAHGAHVGKALRHLGHALGEGARVVAQEQHLIGGARRLDLVARKTVALHADDVEALEPRPVAQDGAERDDVALDAGDAADHGVPPDADELMHRREAAEHGAVADRDVARERRVVRHDDVVAELAIVRDMDADHEQAAVADARDHAAALGAGIHGDVLADHVAAADDELRRLAAIFQILRLVPDRGEREYARAVADRGAPGDDDVRQKLDAVAQLDMLPDMAERADLGRVRDARARLDDGRGMDFGHQGKLNYP